MTPKPARYRIVEQVEPRPKGTSPGAAAREFERLIRREVDYCVLWPFSVGSSGYGQLGRRSVHVLSCERAHGPRPDGMQATHACGNRTCVNPRHLRWATASQNNREAAGQAALRRLSA